MRLVNSQIELTPGEVTALEEAHKIVSERAEKEHGEYNDEMLEWWLLGRLNAGQSTEELLEWARTAPFQQKKK